MTDEMNEKWGLFDFSFRFFWCVKDGTMKRRSAL